MTIFGTLGRMTLALAAVTALSTGTALAQDFYKGKRITVFVGSGPGGGYDTYARMMGRHMGKHIPGNPEFLVKNMDGAGSIIAANFVYNVAPQDGTVIAALQRNAPIVQIMGQKGPKFKATEFNWIGSFNNEVGIIAVAKRTGVTSLKQLFEKEVVFGSTGPNDTEFYPALITNTIGAKVKLIKGYPSTPPAHLAMERGEIDGISQSWASFQQQSQMYKDGKMNLLAQVSLKALPELKEKGVPLLMDFVTEDRLRPGYDLDQLQTIYRLLLATKTMGRPYAMGPKVPADKVKTIRAAFAATAEDPAFKKEADKQGRDLSLVTGDEIQDIVNRMASAKPETLKKLESVSQWTGPAKVVKVELPEFTGKVTKTERGGRSVTIGMDGGKTKKASISGSRTKVTIDGKEDKRGNIKVGMTCTFAMPTEKAKEAKTVSCK